MANASCRRSRVPPFVECFGGTACRFGRCCAEDAGACHQPVAAPIQCSDILGWQRLDTYLPSHRYNTDDTFRAFCHQGPDRSWAAIGALFAVAQRRRTACQEHVLVDGGIHADSSFWWQRGIRGTHSFYRQRHWQQCGPFFPHEHA